MWRRLLVSALESDEAFVSQLKKILDEIDISAKELSTRTGVSASELYKILAGHRGNWKMETYRKIINYTRRVEGDAKRQGKKPFIAIIAFKSVLETLPASKVTLGKSSYDIREYAARTIEDCLVAAIEAERDGANAIVCAPVLGATVEKLVNIPVVTITPPAESLLKAAGRAAGKIRATSKP